MRNQDHVRLRIEMLAGQSKVLGEVLAKALAQNDDSTFYEYSIRLGVICDEIEELRWVLNERDTSNTTHSPHLLSTNLDVRVQNPTKEDHFLTVGQLLDKLKSGELSMNHLTSEVTL